MSQSKYNNLSSDIASLFQDKCHATDKLLYILEVFIKQIKFNNGLSLKTKGYSLKSLFGGLFMFPFMSVLSVFAAQKTGFATICTAKKDAYYTMLRNERINWRNLLKQFTLFFIQKTKLKTPTTKYFILDDTDYEKTGKHIEGVNYIFNHVDKNYILGFKLLCLTMFDGISHIPIDFSLHSEDCSNKLNAKNQFSKSRERCTSGYKRINELVTSKLTSSIEMIKRAVKAGIYARYLLADSWFVCDELISSIKSISKCTMDVIGMVKMDKRKYKTNYSGIEQNIHVLIKIRQECEQYCKKHKLHYIKIKAKYKDTDVILWAIRSGNGSERKVILSSDLRLSFIDVIHTYKIRWSIEVMFKELKQYLNLTHCHARDFDAHIASVSISLMQHTALTLVLRFEKYETMGGLFRDIVNSCIQATIFERIKISIEKIENELGEMINCCIFDLLEKIFSSNISIIRTLNYCTKGDV